MIYVTLPRCDSEFRRSTGSFIFLFCFPVMNEKIEQSTHACVLTLVKRYFSGVAMMHNKSAWDGLVPKGSTLVISYFKFTIRHVSLLQFFQTLLNQLAVVLQLCELSALSSFYTGRVTRKRFNQWRVRVHCRVHKNESSTSFVPK